MKRFLMETTNETPKRNGGSICDYFLFFLFIYPLPNKKKNEKNEKKRIRENANQ